MPCCAAVVINQDVIDLRDTLKGRKFQGVGLPERGHPTNALQAFLLIAANRRWAG